MLNVLRNQTPGAYHHLRRDAIRSTYLSDVSGKIDSNQLATCIVCTSAIIEFVNPLNVLGIKTQAQLATCTVCTFVIIALLHLLDVLRNPTEGYLASWAV